MGVCQDIADFLVVYEQEIRMADALLATEACLKRARCPNHAPARARLAGGLSLIDVSAEVEISELDAVREFSDHLELVSNFQFISHTSWRPVYH